MSPTPSSHKFVKELQTTGWSLAANKENFSTKDQTLEEALRASHKRHVSGEDPGTIKKIENMIELDLIQIKELWAYLGLPI